MSDLFDTLSVLILMTAFVLMANKKVKAYIKTFRVQSALIALSAGILGTGAIVDEGRYDLMVICVLIVILKVIYIPGLLLKTYAGIEYRTEKDFILNIPILVLISCSLVVFTYFSLAASSSINEGVIDLQLVNTISVTMIGLLFMITRKKAIGQIIGFLEVENGIFITAMFSTRGMPFIVDMGIFIDMLTAVMIMGVLVFKINITFESINTDRLNKLKG